MIDLYIQKNQHSTEHQSGTKNTEKRNVGRVNDKRSYSEFGYFSHWPSIPAQWWGIILPKALGSHQTVSERINPKQFLKLSDIMHFFWKKSLLFCNLPITWKNIFFHTILSKNIQYSFKFVFILHTAYFIPEMHFAIPRLLK